MDYATIYAAPQEASLVELGMALGDCSARFALSPAGSHGQSVMGEKCALLERELSRRDALFADLRAALEMACHNIGENGCAPEDYLRYVGERRNAKGAE